MLSPYPRGSSMWSALSNGETSHSFKVGFEIQTLGNGL